MRIVLDTNVLVRAAISSTSPARELLQLVTAELHVLIVSSFLLTEVLRVLGYPRIRTRTTITDEDAGQFVDDLQRVAEIIEVDVPETPLSTDPDDDPVVALAVAGRAEVLCTLDRHFRQPAVAAYCSQHGVRVLSDVELLGELRKGEVEEGNSD